MIKLHTIYQLYLQYDVTNPKTAEMIKAGSPLYLGSSKISKLVERRNQHRQGECRTTAKMAKKWGINLKTLQMKAVRTWTSKGDNPENGMLRAEHYPWNFPYAFTSEDVIKGSTNGRAKALETNLRNGTGFHNPKVRAMGLKSLRDNLQGVYDPKFQDKIHVICRKRGTGVYDPKVRAMGRETNLKNGTGFWDPKTGTKGAHVHWHVNRNVSSPSCEFCRTKRK